MFLWAWGCSGTSSNRAEVGPGNVVLAPTDGGSVVVPDGCVLKVVLPSNPTTGYRWQVDQLPPGMAVEGESRFVRDPDQPTIGGGGTEEWRFAAVLEGGSPSAAAGHGEREGTLRMSYRRPWEADAAPARTYSATVSIVKR